MRGGGRFDTQPYIQVRLCNTVISVLYLVYFAVKYSINLEYSKNYRIIELQYI